MKVKTSDKYGWQEKELTEEGVVLGCECGQHVYFTIEGIIKAQSQEKYCYCGCVMQLLMYVK